MSAERPSEDRLVASFARLASAGRRRPRGVVAGVGDDCAVVRGDGEDLLLTTDALVEHRHFEREWFSGHALGWRAAAVNLSDIAAMGGRPRYALVSLFVPDGEDLAYVTRIEKGIADHLARHGAAIVGGNVSGTEGPLAVDVVLVGACARKAAWMRAARAGDAILVIGELGNAAAGLALLREGRSAPPRLVRAYLRPAPRLDVSELLEGERAVRAAIDVSDGLSTDLIRMCRAGRVGCDVEAAKLPLSRALEAFCIARGEDPVAWALRGGDDYALVLGVAPAAAPAVRARVERRLGVSAVVVGRFTASAGTYRLLGEDGGHTPIQPTGWDHLR
ncbi:MAG: thiamine-phosphate kinase [Candidatus Krumholzibacteria bacterium]|nr:thiamine-phosphate kinase [Candidatus Krumholzibacteria bacterium]